MHNVQVRIVIAGAGGRMGRQLIQLSLQKKNVVLSACLERSDSEFLGNDAGELVGIGKIGIIVQNNLTIGKDNFDVLIDFTHPANTFQYLEFCCKNKKSMVIGTTGFNEAEKTAIKAASKKIAIVFTANFSIGINIILDILERTAKIMGDYVDIEIIEAHHRCKVDTPSGTALMMGEVIAKAMGKNLKMCEVYRRKGCTGIRTPGSIGFSAVRAGGIVGEHTIMFADTNECVEITHKAINRISFAEGAIKSALWLKLKEEKSGLFDMRDVLDLRNKE